MSFVGDLLGTNSNNNYQQTINAQQISDVPTIAPDGSILNNQNSLVQALQNQAAGNGPSAAEAYLNSAGQQAAANANAQAAGNRGINPALAAYQAQSTGANAMQGAAQQGVQARMQEQLNAQGQLGSQLNSMQQQNLGAQQANQQTNLGMQTANQNAYGNAAGQNAELAKQTSQSNAQVTGSLLSGGGAGLSLLGTFLAKGGEVHAANPKVAAVSPADRFPGAAEMPEHLLAVSELYHGRKMAHGGKVPVMLSPGEGKLTPQQAQSVAEGKENPLKVAKKVPGKASVSGDSEKNDTVPDKMEEGGIVIPRSIMQSADPEKEAARFVAEHLSKNGSGSHQDDFKQALKQAIQGRKKK